jgi:hypothetical protein
MVFPKKILKFDMEKKNQNNKYYKVVFKGVTELDQNNLALTFEAICLEEPIKVDPTSIIKVKELADKNENILFFQNIKEVIQLGKNFRFSNYNYFFVLLLTLKSNNSKKGILIGNVKSIGDIIIGIWPIDFKLKKEFDIYGLPSELNLISDNLENYLNITLIN